jgi:8-oxo-dGTP diphosphatase
MDLRKKKIVATLVFPIRGNEVLLSLKASKIGKDLLNGWGGEQKEGELIEKTAQREFKEESNLWLEIRDLVYSGKVVFHNQKDDGRKFDVEVHIFLIFKWSGEIKIKKDEIKDYGYCPVSNLPFDRMLPSDKDWLPQVLAGKKINGETWQKWEKDSKGKVHYFLTRPSEIKIVKIE